MKNLVFLSKSIGLDCLLYHLDTFPEDENTIVVCDPEKEMIMNTLSGKNASFIDVKDFSIDFIKSTHFDWLLNLWGGYIFKSDLLKQVKNSLNIHPSYLPYGRGRDPVVWAIRNNEIAGATLHEINDKVDEGAIWYQEEVPYTFPTKGADLYDKVVAKCIQIFKERWSSIRSLKCAKKDQPIDGYATKRRKHLIEDQSIAFDDLSDAQKNIFRQILAHDFGHDYTSKLLVNGATYKIQLELEKIDDEAT